MRFFERVRSVVGAIGRLVRTLYVRSMLGISADEYDALVRDNRPRAPVRSHKDHFQLMHERARIRPVQRVLWLLMLAMVGGLVTLNELGAAPLWLGRAVLLGWTFLGVTLMTVQRLAEARQGVGLVEQCAGCGYDLDPRCPNDRCPECGADLTRECSVLPGRPIPLGGLKSDIQIAVVALLGLAMFAALSIG